MNWEAIGALGEVLGAIAVVLTLAYLAIQIRHAREGLTDQNRLERSRAVREIILTTVSNDQLRMDQMRNWGLEGYYHDLATRLEISTERASGVDWANAYYFWMYWGQYTSTVKSEDINELKHVIRGLLELPGMRLTWDTSPQVKPLLDPEFVKFVQDIIEEKNNSVTRIKNKAVASGNDKFNSNV